MSAVHNKPVKHNGEFIVDTAGRKRIVNPDGAQRLADRAAKRAEKGLLNPKGLVRDDGEYYTIMVHGGIRG